MRGRGRGSGHVRQVPEGVIQGLGQGLQGFAGGVTAGVTAFVTAPFAGRPLSTATPLDGSATTLHCFLTPRKFLDLCCPDFWKIPEPVPYGDSKTAGTKRSRAPKTAGSWKSRTCLFWLVPLNLYCRLDLHCPEPGFLYLYCVDVGTPDVNGSTEGKDGEENSEWKQGRQEKAGGLGDL